MLHGGSAMNHTLKLTETLLVKGRNLHKLGLRAEALDLFRSLSTFRNLPASVAREMHLRLAHLHRQGRRFRQARRHMAVALVHEPLNAGHHYTMARLAEADVHCDPRRACTHYRQALRLDPLNARYLSAYGLFALKNDRPRTALGALRRAFRLSPESQLVLRRYLKVLKQLQRAAEGRRVLRTRRFRLGQEAWFVQLERDFQFFLLHRRQQAQRRQAKEAPVEARSTLQFPTLCQAEECVKEVEFLREDAPAVLPAPHLPLPRRQPGQRYAQ
jgi:tetratricopeptide (TPR) repeat protein